MENGRGLHICLLATPFEPFFFWVMRDVPFGSKWDREGLHEGIHGDATGPLLAAVARLSLFLHRDKCTRFLWALAFCLVKSLRLVHLVATPFVPISQGEMRDDRSAAVR